MKNNVFSIVHMTILHSRYDTRIYFKECMTLSEQGHAVVLLVGDGLGDENRDGVRILDIGAPPKGRLVRFIKQSFRMYRAVRHLKPEIVHFHDPELMIVAKIFGLLGISVIFDVHEDVAKGILTKPWIPKTLRVPVAHIYSMIERLFSSSMALVMAEESYIVSYESHGSKKKVVVENLPLLELTELAVAQNDKFSSPTVVYFGSVTVARGALRLIRVVSQLRLTRPDVKLVIIGPVSEEVSNSKYYIQAIKESWLVSYGYIPQDQALKIVTRCHVGVAVLDPEPNYVKSYPTKIFEYMALGLPVIVSNFKLYKEVLDYSHCGFAVNPLDELELQSALDDVINHPERAAESGLSGRRAVMSKYNWTTQGQQLLNFYQEINT